MNLFYSPYSKTSMLPPQADIMNILQWLWMMKLFGPQRQQQGQLQRNPQYSMFGLPPGLGGQYGMGARSPYSQGFSLSPY